MNTSLFRADYWRLKCWTWWIDEDAKPEFQTGQEKELGLVIATPGQVFMDQVFNTGGIEQPPAQWALGKQEIYDKVALVSAKPDSCAPKQSSTS